tara:strand:+ start:434 stop:712 length:279 start_codon:yes stop_codon:yes gene_type:complete
MSKKLDEKNPNLSKEELKQRREEITKFYQDNLPHLKIQAEYENLLASIEKSRAERLQAQTFMAQAFADTPEGGEPNEEAKAFMDAVKNFKED